jgi:predicted nucleic acid-binding protein
MRWIACGGCRSCCDPNAAAAEELLTLVESGTLQGFVSAITISNIHHILKDLHKHKDPLPALGSLLSFLEVVPTSKKILLEAMEGGFKDYEDGIQHASAVTAKCTHLVTRDARDFKRSRIPVVSDSEMCALARA